MRFSVITSIYCLISGKRRITNLKRVALLTQKDLGSQGTGSRDRGCHSTKSQARDNAGCDNVSFDAIDQISDLPCPKRAAGIYQSLGCSNCLDKLGVRCGMYLVAIRVDVIQS